MVRSQMLSMTLSRSQVKINLITPLISRRIQVHLWRRLDHGTRRFNQRSLRDPAWRREKCIRFLGPLRKAEHWYGHLLHDKLKLSMISQDNNVFFSIVLPDPDPFVQKRSLLKIMVEDSFNYRALDSDLAILTLSSPAVLTFAVRPVCYPQTSNSFLEEYQLTPGVSSQAYLTPNVLNL